MKNILSVSLVALLACPGLYSCQKVINVNLNAAAPKLNIEANISDQPSSCIVKLSRTVNFDESNTFPAVSGAVITINDNSGDVATLNEISTGIYTSSMQAIPGRTYTISISTGGNTYTATSTVPNPVSIDSLIQDSISNGFSGEVKINKFIDVQFHDPAGINNYYRFVEIVNGDTLNTLFIGDDRLRDGFIITQSLLRRDSTLSAGDNVQVLMQSIDKSVHDYFNTLRQIVNGGGQTATPANPVSNFNGGVLGYFSAYAVRSKFIVIK